MNGLNELAKVTRFEVIDHTTNGEGRVFVKYGNNLKLETSSQDNDRTMKLFITDTKAPVPVNKSAVKQFYAYSLLLEAAGEHPTPEEKDIIDKLAKIIKK